MELQKRISRYQSQADFSFFEKLQDSFVEEINVYNQAYIHLTTPLITANKFHDITQYEIPLFFNFNGDRAGSIICLLDLYKKNLPQEELAFFQSLYMESMNILLGKIITILHDLHNIDLSLSSPIIPKKNNVHQIFNEKIRQDGENFIVNYILISHLQEFQCRILWSIERKASLLG